MLERFGIVLVGLGRVLVRFGVGVRGLLLIGPGGRPVEIQLRTVEMNARAERGIAAHWGYKGAGRRRNNEKEPAWLARVLDWDKESSGPEEFMSGLRAELDAAYAHLYGLSRDELRYILDPADVKGEDYPSETFRVLKTNEIRRYGEYRTRRLVLEAWDHLTAEAAAAK